VRAVAARKQARAGTLAWVTRTGSRLACWIYEINTALVAPVEAASLCSRRCLGKARSSHKQRSFHVVAVTVTQLPVDPISKCADIACGCRQACVIEATAHARNLAARGHRLSTIEIDHDPVSTPH
jgi:hypothetical protein